MSGSRRKPIALPAPYLRRLWLDETHISERNSYPFCLPIFAKGFDLSFDSAITIIVGENGTGKSTILEGIAALAGYDDAGGGKGYMPLDHTGAVDEGRRHSRKGASSQLAAEDNERLVLQGRELLFAHEIPPDFLSHSHGEGFLRFFEERCARQGLYIFDEPESALSPARQIEFLKLLRRMELSRYCQVIMATHSPILMAYPEARLLLLTQRELAPAVFAETDHFPNVAGVLR